MSVTDTSLADWSTAAATNTPVGGATPEIDDELRNIKAVCKTNIVALTTDQTIAGVKTFSSFPVFPSTSPTASSQGANKLYVDSAVTAYAVATADRNAADGVCGLDANTLVEAAYLGTGATTNTYLRGDQSFQLPDNPLIILEHRQNSGTNGGGQASGSWTTRTLNTEVVDTDSLCSLTANQFTIAAGTYEIDCRASLYSIGVSQLRLYNVSDTAVQQDVSGNDIYSLVSPAIGGQYDSNMVHLSSRFTLASQQILRIESRVSYTNTTNGWGYASTFGSVEIYAQVKLRQVG